MNLQSLDLFHFFTRRFHGSCQEGETPARDRVVPRGDFAPMRSNNAERTLRPLWVIIGHLQCGHACPLYPQERTCAVQLGMSALGQKRTSARTIMARLIPILGTAVIECSGR